jgi:PKD repeat protein
VGRYNVTGNSGGSLAATVPYPGSLNDSQVGLYERNSTGTYERVSTVGGNAVTVDGNADTVSATLVPGTYAVLEVNRSTGGSLPLGERLFPTGLPASSTGDPPTDVDGDGKLEDMDGDGVFRFIDVIEFVFSQQRGNYGALSGQQVDALDLDENGRVTFVDVIDLVFELQGQ